MNESFFISKVSVKEMLISWCWQLFSSSFGEHTLARHAVATQVVADRAETAAGVLGSGEAEL